MRNEEWRRVEELLNAALELEPAARQKFLEEASAGAPEVRREVESLLVCEGEADNFLAAPALAFSADFFEDGGGRDARAGQTIGRYRIVREIGHGGMGSVFLAERSDGEFTQTVALKIVRQAILDGETRKRFRRERQILASLNHPNIARLLDGGVADSGEPFLVMEYVEGEPLLEFAARQNLGVEGRLRLFLKVCSAVQYAHRNLVIHRDIKPSNVMVTKAGEPKLFDFGLAKIFDAAPAHDATQTATGFRALTPAYASPEQLHGKNITTASDIYSLGVVLYELLTGARPFHFGNKRFEEILRKVDTTEPQRPSDAATRARADAETRGGREVGDAGRRARGEGVRTPSASHGPAFQGPAVPPSRLRGDLDNIILNALRKEPERRYKSVEQFAADIERHLRGLPVAARPSTFQYRAGKFVKRNRLFVAASALVILSLVAGAAAAVWQAGVARAKARIAAENQAKAELEAARSKKISRFMEKVLSYANPAWYAEGNRLRGQARVIDVLDELSEKIEAEFPGEPDIQAEMHHKCAEIYLANRMRERAELHARRALELRRSVFGEKHAEVAKDLYYLGAVLVTRSNVSEAEKLLRQSASIFREVAPDNPNLPYLLEDLGNSVAAWYGDFDAAEKLMTEALELFRRHDGEAHPSTARLQLQLSVMAARKGDFARADALYREGEARAAQSANAEIKLQPVIYAGKIESARGNRAAAEASLRHYMAEIRKLKGENSLPEGEAASQLWEVFAAGNDWAKAAELARAEAEREKNASSETSVRFGERLTRLSISLIRGGRAEEAKPFFEKARRIYLDARHDEAEKRYLGVDIGECLLLLERREEAARWLEEIHLFFKANFPPNYRGRIRAENLLAQARAKN